MNFFHRNFLPSGDFAIPLLCAIGAQTLGLVCFDVYRATHWAVVPFPVVVPLSVFVGFHVWRIRRVRAALRAHRQHLQTLRDVATCPESEDESPVVGSYAFNGVVVSVTQCESEQMDEWVQLMPQSVARKIGEAHKLAALLK